MRAVLLKQEMDEKQRDGVDGDEVVVTTNAMQFQHMDKFDGPSGKKILLGA